MTPPDLTTALAELALMLWQHEESLASWAERNPGGLFFPDDFIACAKRRAAAAWKIHDHLRAGRASEDEVAPPSTWYELEADDPPPAGARDVDVEAVREALTKYRTSIDAMYNSGDAGRAFVLEHFGMWHPHSGETETFLDRLTARLAQAERERDAAIADNTTMALRLARYDALTRRAKEAAGEREPLSIDKAYARHERAWAILRDLAALEETR